MKWKKTVLIAVGLAVLITGTMLACLFSLTTPETRLVRRADFLGLVSSNDLYPTGITVPDENGRVAFYRKVSVWPRDREKLSKLRGEKTVYEAPFEHTVYSFGKTGQFIVEEVGESLVLYRFQNYLYSYVSPYMDGRDVDLDGYVFGDVSMGYVLSNVYGLKSGEDISSITVSRGWGSGIPQLLLLGRRKTEAFNALWGVTLGEMSAATDNPYLEGYDVRKITVHFGAGERFSFYFDRTSGTVFWEPLSTRGHVLSPDSAAELRDLLCPV